MLCHCVTAANRARYSLQLEAMFRMRHEVFVDGRGWGELRREDRRDIDQYDTAETVYLLVLEDAGEVVASARLNPVFARHQMEEGGPLRRQFVDRPPPGGPNIWEASRLIGGFRERYGRDFARATLGILLAASQEFCARRGVGVGLSILDTQSLFMMQSVGLESEPLGLPVEYQTERGPSVALAVIWKAGVRYLIRIRQAFGIVGPVLFEAAPVLGEKDADLPVLPLLEAAAEIRGVDARRALLGHARYLIEQETVMAFADGEAHPAATVARRGRRRRSPAER